MGVGITDYDRANMDRIMAGYGDWFTAKLLRLMAKADAENLDRLRQVYPEEVQAWVDWYYRDRD